jgi:hypothetical protein
VKEHRQSVDQGQTLRQAEGGFSELVSASLDYYRDVRDAACEAMFFEMYGTMVARENGAEMHPQPGGRDDNPAVEEFASTSVDKGGIAEAISRAGYLLATKGKPLPLAQFELKKKLMAKFGYLLPRLTPDQMRVIRGNQEVICRHEPERAVTTLPLLLSNPSDRERFLTLLDAVVEDYSAMFGITEEQSAMLTRIRNVLCAEEVSVVS